MISSQNNDIFIYTTIFITLHISH
ncbi:hypothetical protein ECPA39_4732, partial [Escherichia coli PA39]